MKLITFASLVALFSAPIQAQSCQYQAEVHACVQDAENRHNVCGGNPSCSCIASEAWALCYTRCQGDPMFLDRLNFVNGQIAQHCARPGFVGGPGVIPSGIAPIPGIIPGNLGPGAIPGAFPSAIPGVAGPFGQPRQAFGSMSDNQMQFQATATFRSGGLNSQSFRNSATGIKAAPIIVSAVAFASVIFTAL
ncbi:hypothetical protein CONCODRAFT_71203 [Conidiobolus coronatus NRRL 28638]|uniref:Extracellular membrane protein CFEM domain-containing protein n=1 Tax=Conidiobolus coronatus (strain ATCC 28846 / CBS 209.66 / NRRL 28638) TaxID=796925 RepID=A0A137P408_CONC2|nr:hypothetical protein CONCODRAFT_71203 [Conidiobolus coronatus NRRL 28638]|eukprot:KXN69747.1 hypothetical protein CONCODRAFT_71203 [Conidiobolus coronatus NRRL 28638]